MKDGCCEIVTRDKSVACKVQADEVIPFARELTQKMLDEGLYM